MAISLHPSFSPLPTIPPPPVSLGHSFLTRELGVHEGEEEGVAHAACQPRGLHGLHHAVQPIRRPQLQLQIVLGVLGVKRGRGLKRSLYPSSNHSLYLYPSFSPLPLPLPLPSPPSPFLSLSPSPLGTRAAHCPAPPPGCAPYPRRTRTPAHGPPLWGCAAASPAQMPRTWESEEEDERGEGEGKGRRKAGERKAKERSVDVSAISHFPLPFPLPFLPSFLHLTPTLHPTPLTTPSKQGRASRCKCKWLARGTIERLLETKAGL